MQILGSYELEAKLGSGGMGHVYGARQRQLGRVVALKVLHPDLRSDATCVARFYREMRTGASLRHPNLVRIFDGGAVQNSHYFAMEPLDGTSLQSLIKAEGPLKSSPFLPLAEGIVRPRPPARPRPPVVRQTDRPLAIFAICFVFLLAGIGLWNQRIGNIFRTQFMPIASAFCASRR